jgi:hypothetical protein
MKPPACYYPNGVVQPVPTLPYARIAGWHASGPVARLTGPPWRAAEPEKAESACDLIAFYRDHPYATCSFRTAQVLAALHAQYAIRREIGP